ncbi:MAG: winged helix-turn-helix transcriptional regulator [Spirochaetaceae bacterium]
MTKEEREYLILKSIKDGQDTIRQRDIAKIAGVSLGMTNTIIKKMIDKGLLKTKQISPKHIRYLLTIKGLSAIKKRGSDFLKSTIKNVIVFNESINIIVKNLKEENYTSINLIGDSDLLFLLEYSCGINNIVLTTDRKEINNKETKNIYADELNIEVLDSYLVTATF